MLPKNLGSNISDYFENGRVPQLIYVTRQEFGIHKVNRPMHRHAEICELLIVYQGYDSYYVEDRVFPITSGDILFYNAGDLHEVRSEFQTEIGTYCFGFTDLQLPNLPKNHIIPADKSFACSSGVKQSFIFSLCTIIFDKMTGGCKTSDFLVQILSTALLLTAKDLSVENVTPEPIGNNRLLASRIKSYIDTHYAEELSLAGIAESLNISPYYAAHVFKNVMGHSPIQYMIRRRIGEAQTLLINSEYSATQISTMVGYDNTNYFCTLFTKIVGLSPIRYRANYYAKMYGQRTQ